MPGVLKIRSRLLRAGGRLAPSLLAGVFLLLVPTVFSLYPAELADLRLWIRILVGLGWTGLAVLVVAGGAAKDRDVKQAVNALEAMRGRAVSEILSVVLRPGTGGSPEQYRWSVALLDGGSDLLLPNFPFPVTDPGDPRVFAVGCGAAGQAFRERKPIAVWGDAVSSPSYHLKPAQQVYFSEFKSVAAVPILIGGTIPVGVVSAIGHEDDQFFANPSGAGARLLLDRAELVGVVLADTLFGPAG